MGLTNFLYRCPRCGSDPTEPAGSGAVCVGCRATFRASTDGRILVRLPDGSAQRVPAADLAEDVERLGGPMTAATDADGRIRYGASAVAFEARGMAPVRAGGEVVGFVESFGRGSPGRLEVTEDELSFAPHGQAPLLVTRIDAIRAVQTSSASLQLDLDGRLVQFRFETDSSRRWEGLLRELISRAYRRQGRGEVVEFQPRVVTA